MLGVFGCVPAFDRYFRAGFRTSGFGPKSLREIKSFYEENEEVLEGARRPTIEFSSSKPSSVRYTAAKVIDMIFFIEGQK